MKVSELMERVGSEETGRVIAYLKDGLEEMNMTSPEHVTSTTINIVKDQRYYELPNNYVKILDIRVKNQANSNDEYRSIPRMIGEPPIEDAPDSNTFGELE